jgi:hypothetical protein
MRALIGGVALMVAAAAWAAEKPLPVLVKNPSVTVQAADAGQYTHLGQKSSQVVNLRFTNNQPASRIDPATGLPDTSPFEVPSGFVFVLTDMHGSPICTPGTNLLYILFQDVGGGQVFRDRKSSACPGTGDGSNERHYSTGLLFGAGSRLVAAISPTTDHFLLGEGYLVPAR